MKTVFLTPSYRGDFERCRLLCESTSRFLPAGIEHLLIVDRRDMALFRPLQNATVRLIEAEALLPWWIFRLPGVKGWRASLASLPVRNWIFQQLLKISAARSADAEIVQFLDSDVALIRPFDPAYLTQDGLVRLQRTRFEDPHHRKWREVARRLLGIPADVTMAGNYVGNFITWRRSNVLSLTDRIERQTGRSWVRALASEVQFSEYMLYGAFIDHVAGLTDAGHFHDDRPNLAMCWDPAVQTDRGMQAFFDGVPADSFGVMIHSKFHIPVAKYRAHVEQLWDRIA